MKMTKLQDFLLSVKLIGYVRKDYDCALLVFNTKRQVNYLIKKLFSV